MKALVVHFPGSNREQDAMAALRQVGFSSVDQLWHKETSAPTCDFIMLPGGFAYGDYLRSGAIAAGSPVMNVVRNAAMRGVPILGVCNGFQILCESGLLPGILVHNRLGRFVCGLTSLLVESTNSAFMTRYKKGEVLRYPVAHGEGNYQAHANDIQELEAQDRVLLRYVSSAGVVKADHENLNGSQKSIAGICSENRQIVGMMPHPENAIGHTATGQDGERLFSAIIDMLNS